MKTITTELTFDQQVNLQAAVISSLRSSWKFRSSLYFRKRVCEDIELLRFMRSNSIMGRKFIFEQPAAL